jgi:hypothetical protein
MKSFLLKPLYNRAVDGIPGLGTPAETAARFLAGPGTLHERAEEMTGTYTLLCGSAGFVFGLGGFITLPITLPANIIGVATLQLHLCAATAFMGGHDIHDDEVRKRSIACLVSGSDAEHLQESDEATEVFDRSAVKLAERGIRFLAEGAVGIATRATKWTATKVVTSRLPRRSLPILGGFIGGASDAYSTGKVAEVARQTFLTDGKPLLTAAELAAGDGAG